MTFEGHFRCRNHLSTNTSVTYYAHDLHKEGVLSVDGRRLSVCLSVRPVSGPKWRTESPRKPMIRVTREPVSKSPLEVRRRDG